MPKINYGFIGPHLALHRSKPYGIGVPYGTWFQWNPTCSLYSWNLHGPMMVNLLFYVLSSPLFCNNYEVAFLYIVLCWSSFQCCTFPCKTLAYVTEVIPLTKSSLVLHPCRGGSRSRSCQAPSRMATMGETPSHGVTTLSHYAYEMGVVEAVHVQACWSL